MTWLRRKVRARIEGLPFRCHEHRRRPAARAGHPDRRLHRHRIHVGSLLAVDLHVDEEVVHDGSGRGALERLVRHDVAPVARAVADRDEQRLVLRPCPLEGLVAPRVPVDRVLGVLEQIWARSARKTVHSEEGTRAAKSRCSELRRRRAFAPADAGQPPRADRARVQCRALWRLPKAGGSRRSCRRSSRAETRMWPRSRRRRRRRR